VPRAALRASLAGELASLLGTEAALSLETAGFNRQAGKKNGDWRSE